MSFQWTGDLIGEVATYLKQGLSAAQIGAQLGISRNAVIGKVSRDDKLSRIGFARKSQRPQPFDRDPPKRLEAVWAKKPKTVKQTRPPRPVFIDTLPYQVAGKPMLMLEASECKWVVNDADVSETHLFCGIQTDTGHYCQHHKSKLYARRTIDV